MPDTALRDEPPYGRPSLLEVQEYARVILTEGERRHLKHVRLEHADKKSAQAILRLIEKVLTELHDTNALHGLALLAVNSFGEDHQEDGLDGLRERLKANMQALSDDAAGLIDRLVAHFTNLCALVPMEK